MLWCRACFILLVEKLLLPSVHMWAWRFVCEQQVPVREPRALVGEMEDKLQSPTSAGIGKRHLAELNLAFARSYSCFIVGQRKLLLGMVRGQPRAR